MIKNIIFDWSGTLSDDLFIVYTASMNVFEKIGLNKISLEEYKKEFTLPYMKFYHKFKEDLDKEELDRLFFKEINSIGEPKQFPDVKKILEFLIQKNIKIAILSSHHQEKLEKEIKNYGFQKLFINTHGSIYNKVEKIVEIMERNNFKSHETAYVGDMTHDIEAGRKARVTTIAVSWGYQSKEMLSEENPDFIIDDLSELIKMV